MLSGISCREYEAAAEAVPGAFALSSSTVSRRFIRASAKELRKLGERRLDDAEWIALVMDGKTFAGDQIVIALGVTRTGENRDPTYADAKRALRRLVQELALVNESAARSLEEGLEETLTLHGLGLFPELGVSFRTTNLIESVMARLEEKTARVDHWRTSDQKLRWCGAALLAVEKTFRRVKGYQQLPLLVKALRATMKTTTEAAA